MTEPIYTVETRINRPVDVVFDAVVDSNRLCGYFTNRASGSIVEGESIVWHWDAWGDYPIVVKTVIPNERIELELDSKEWKKTETHGYKVGVIMVFESLPDGKTMLSISERGWRTDAPGLKASYENCAGWQHMAMCLKGYIEHGIDLR